ncbi:hypothetical protein IT575_12095 [bacterium]|nr:hypothetical protein [bacterium]
MASWEEIKAAWLGGGSANLARAYGSLSGSGQWLSGDCPECGKPKLVVNTHSGAVSCRIPGCHWHRDGRWADVIEWLQHYDGLDFLDAAQRVGDWVGLTLTRSPQAEAQHRERKSREDLLEDSFEWMRGRIRQALGLLEKQGEHARLHPDYGQDAGIVLSLQRARGYSLTEIGQMPLGTLPSQPALKDHLLSGGRWKLQDWIDSKFYKPLPRSEDGSTDCAFGTTHRLCGLVRNAAGRALTMTAWQSDGPPSPAKYGFLKDWPKAGALCGLERLRGSSLALLVEGYFDALYPGYCHGFPAVGILGASLSAEHVAGLKSAGIKRVVLAFDNEPWKLDTQGRPYNPGHSATVTAVKLLAQSGLDCLVAQWPAELGKDLDNCCRSGHAEALREAQEQAISGAAWLGREIASGRAA